MTALIYKTTSVHANKPLHLEPLNFGGITRAAKVISPPLDSPSANLQKIILENCPQHGTIFKAIAC